VRWQLVREYAAQIGIGELAPHDLAAGLQDASKRWVELSQSLTGVRERSLVSVSTEGYALSVEKLLTMESPTTVSMTITSESENNHSEW
jgi:hypothetical protein